MWWERPDLGYDADTLRFQGQEVRALAVSEGTPLYLYNAGRVTQNLTRLREALRARGLSDQVFYAMKANRFAPLLTFLKTLGHCGIDACSPAEVALARQCGFAEDQISFTATSLSNADLDALLARPNLLINCDSLSAIRRVGERAPGRAIGLRVNPGIGVGYAENERLHYAGERPTKFGIYPDRLVDALALVRQFDLQVIGLHLHVGCGYLTEQLSAWEEALRRSAVLARKLPDLQHVNVGGGLGIPLTAADAPLDLNAWSAALERQMGSLKIPLRVEPGDYLVKDAGVLVLEVNTVEEKQGRLFVGVNGGFNTHIEPAFYHLPLEVVPCRRPDPDAPLRPTTIAGNINEAHDLLAEDIPLPPIGEGDLLAFLNAGGYGASMSSNHCLRGQLAEYLLF